MMMLEYKYAFAAILSVSADRVPSILPSPRVSFDSTVKDCEEWHIFILIVSLGVARPQTCLRRERISVANPSYRLIAKVLLIQRGHSIQFNRKTAV